MALLNDIEKASRVKDMKLHASKSTGKFVPHGEDRRATSTDTSFLNFASCWMIFGVQNNLGNEKYVSEGSLPKSIPMALWMSSRVGRKRFNMSMSKHA